MDLTRQFHSQLFPKQIWLISGNHALKSCLSLDEDDSCSLLTKESSHNSSFELIGSTLPSYQPCNRQTGRGTSLFPTAGGFRSPSPGLFRASLVSSASKVRWSWFSNLLPLLLPTLLNKVCPSQKLPPHYVCSVLKIHPLCVLKTSLIQGSFFLEDVFFKLLLAMHCPPQLQLPESRLNFTNSSFCCHDSEWHL